MSLMIVLAVGGDAGEIDELDKNAAAAAGGESCGIRKSGHWFTSYSSCGSIFRSRHISAAIHGFSVGQFCPSIKRKIKCGLVAGALAAEAAPAGHKKTSGFVRTSRPAPPCVFKQGLAQAKAYATHTQPSVRSVGRWA
jgi:hypothetical protein